MSAESNPTLKRSLGLGAVVALGINGVIGQGIFLLPGKAAGLMGPSAFVALILGGILCFLIALCFAEVGSRFQGTGGAYLYVREAFGSFAGFEVGWMTCCVAVIAWATLANGFTLVLAHFLPGVDSGWMQPCVAVGLVTVLTVVNLLGARTGAAVVMTLTVAKLIPIAIFILVGVFFFHGGHFVPFAPSGYGSLGETTLILLYAYVGFETLVVPAGEMANPQRSVPLAMFLVMAIVTGVYLAVFAVAVGVYPDISGHPNPVAGASAHVMGGFGGTLVAAGIVLSVFGTNAGAALVNPRRFFAMAERGDLPRRLASVDPETGAPRLSIFVTYVLVVALTLSGTFEQLLKLGVVARFVQYIPTCLALIVFRRRDAAAGTSPDSGYRVPFGIVIPVVTVLLCVVLLVSAGLRDATALIYGGTALLAGVPLYFLRRQDART